jgi:transketolase
MRDAFVAQLTEHARSDESIMLLTGDLGFNVVEGFGEAFPLQFLNCGVAEQAMMSIAAGLASTRKKVFAYSIVNFATFRCLEQIRNDIAYHGYDVCVVAVGAGAAYGTLGYSHHGLEDVAVMRALPGMRIYSPADTLEVASCVDEIVQRGGPSYLRLGRSPGSSPYSAPPDISSGLIELTPGTDVSLLVTGPLLPTALEAADAAERQGVSVQVTSVPLISPINDALLLERVSGRRIVTLEEHSTIGGLGSAVLESLARSRRPHDVRTLGYPADGIDVSGSHAFINSASGLSPEAVALALTDQG